MSQKQYFSLLIYVILLKLNGIRAFEHYGNCSSPTGFEGYCVELERCKSLHGLLRKTDLKENEISHLRLSCCGFMGPTVLVCCTGSITETITSSFSNAFADGAVDEQQSYPLDVNLQRSIQLLKLDAPSAVELPKPPQCGTQQINRISIGVQTSIDEFPWLALLQYTSSANEKIFRAEGSLINEFYVLTAAHALKTHTDQLTSVRLGEWNISTSPDCVNGRCAPPHIDIAVAKLIPHPDFSARKRTADIGLVRLAERVTYTRFVKPICLPATPALHFNALPANTVAYLAGWGATEDNERSVVKVRTSLRIFDQQDCVERYAQLLQTNITESQICAGGVMEGQPCAGNGGAALMIDGRATVLVGVTSFGVQGCGEWSIPSVFTRVDAYIDWIQATLEP